MSKVPLTVEQKAELFDYLCKTLGRGTFLRTRTVPVADTSDRLPGSTMSREHQYRIVQTYEWRMWSDDEPDFEASMRRYLTKPQPKEMK